MTLGEKQELFLLNAAKLIIWANEQGYHLRGGELHRPLEMQQKYFATGKSKTLNSQHLRKLAIDLYLIKDKVLASHEDYRPLAEYWKSLNPNNRAGYDWGWDANHFEMK